MISTYDRLIEKELEPNEEIMNHYLGAAFRNADTDRTVDALNKFHEKEKEPRAYYLKKLGELKDHPDSLYVALKKFKNQFGYIHRKVRHTSPPTGKRIKTYREARNWHKKTKRTRIKK